MSQITLNNVYLTYPVFGGSSRSLKQDVINTLLFKNNTNKIVCVNALKDISFTLNDGDYVGLIGHNGAGKSTLLKLLSGIYEPTAGSIKVDGAISSILGNQVGMQPELSGYENIKFSSLINNISKNELDDMINDIEEFTELKEFLSMPVKRYSSGMMARLAFSISTAIQPDILLLDEVVGAGDAAFIKKARDRMNQLVSKANILVFASHSNDLIKQFCNKILWLDKGQIKKFGPVEETLDMYVEHMAALA